MQTIETTAPQHSRLRVLTYNIHSCKGSDRRYDPERIVRILERVDADIIALQEVRGFSSDNNQFRFLGHRLPALQGVFGSTWRTGRYSFGNALFVRGHILATRHIDLTVAPFDARGALDCTIISMGARLRVVITHLGLFPNERNEQLAKIAQALKYDTEQTTIILGDFNIFGAEGRRLKRLGAPYPLPKVRTFPALRPILSLDRIWTIPNDRLLSIHSYTAAPARWASDHLPLVAEVSLVTQPSSQSEGEDGGTPEHSPRGSALSWALKRTRRYIRARPRMGVAGSPHPRSNSTNNGQ